MNCARKQSSCELNSRLKTRKLLGVGETNDGEVHRSKLSQVLGHSEQLYLREPKGLRCWQLFSSLLYSCIALSEFLHPGIIIRRPKWTEEEEEWKNSTGGGGDPLIPRLYAAALISLSVLLWRSSLSVDRELIKISLLTSIVYSLIHITVLATVWLLSSSSASSLSVKRHFFISIAFSLDFLHLLAAVGFFSVSVIFYRLAIK